MGNTTLRGIVTLFSTEIPDFCCIYRGCDIMNRIRPEPSAPDLFYKRASYICHRKNLQSGADLLALYVWQGSEFTEGMNLKQTRLHILREPQNLASRARTGVSLHCHTEHSKEMLDFIPHYAEKLPVIAQFWHK